MTIDVAFNTFLERLQLGAKQIDRITSATDSLAEKLARHFGIDARDIFLQGSIANDTAIKPPPSKQDGEYDVDLVVISASHADSPADAIRAMREALVAVGYGGMIEDDGDRERPCIRLRYAKDPAGKFHVDVVPARRTVSGEAPLEVPRPSENRWRPTAPQEYAEWCRSQGPRFARTVQELKRWRDENQAARQAIKSIVLQVLISAHMPEQESDAARVAGALRGIADAVSAHPHAPIPVPNPVLPTVENLTERWPPAAYKDFCRVVADAAGLAEQALALEATDRAQARLCWCKLLGSDFPEDDDGGGQAVPPPPARRRRRTSQEAPRTEWA